jgi:Secretion system C-terminal sorting domain
MIKGTKVFILLIILSGTTCFSQQLSHQVLVPAAGLATAGVLNYSQTVGETAVELVYTADFILTQGFQQPGIKYTDEIPPAGDGVNVYPNPATDFINIKLYGEVARNFKIEIINLTGVIVNSMTIDFTDKYYFIQQIEVSDLKFGFYFVRVMSDDGTINRIFKIEKM